MAIKKFNRNESAPDYASKTQIKHDAVVLKKFGEELTRLPVKTLEKLPLSEVSLKSLLDFQKMTSNLAKKRHLMYIGKCLRKEDEQEIRSALEAESISHLKRKEVQNNNLDEQINSLLIEGETKVDELLTKFPMLERQTLRQIMRNISSAKTDEKKRQAIDKMKRYLNENSEPNRLSI